MSTGEPVIYRDEVLGVLMALADIVVELRGIQAKGWADLEAKRLARERVEREAAES